MRVHIASAENIIRNMIKANQKKKLFSNINDWVNSISNIPNERIRENLYNIEQHRGDAIITIDTKGKSGPNGISGLPKGLSNNTKTSGTSSLIGGGAGNSLTGKNPFAILKASAVST